MTKKPYDKRSPIERQNILSRIFFSWVWTIFSKGYKNDVCLDDLYKHREQDSAEELGKLLETEWKEEILNVRSGKEPCLAKAAIRAFGFRYLSFACLALIGECAIKSVQAISLGYVVRYYSKKSDNISCEDTWRFPNVFNSRSNDITETQHYISAVVLCSTVIVYAITYHQFFYGMHETGMRLRIACSSIIYKKALKLSRSALGETTVGQMVNLLSNDVSKFDQAVIFIPYLIVGPIQTVITGFILWQYLGVSCLAGISVLILLVPFQLVMGKVFAKLRAKIAILTDERVRLMNETVTGMRVIKMYTWEKVFIDFIAGIRKREMNMIGTSAILRGVSISLFYTSSKVILLLLYLTYSLLVDCHISSETAFVSMTLFNNLRLSMAFFYSYGIFQGSEALVSFRRLQQYLLREEQVESKGSDVKDNTENSEDCGVWLRNVSGAWSQNTNSSSLSNVSVTVKPGELLTVIGPVGSGKSTLHMAILGELPLSYGIVKVRGKIAYSSQDPWIFPGDIRSNILFGEQFNEYKYQEVLTACALHQDLEQLPYGDRTLVGERGVFLSGGQRARINLARALYMNADVYLLDDPLSAVDAPVAKHIFERCINGYLRSKVRILVTHQLQFLKYSSKIMVIKNGSCLEYGNYSELRQSGTELLSLIGTNIRNTNADTTSSLTSESHRKSNFMEFIPEKKPRNENLPTQQEETKHSGSISAAVYWKYIRASGGYIFLIIMVLSNLLNQTIFHGSDFWMSSWTEKMSDNSIQGYNCSTTSYNNILPDSNECKRMTYFVSVYAVFCGCLLSVALVRSIMLFILCKRSSEALHNRMLTSMVLAPISFFDNVPIGRILNRSTKDIGLIDEFIPLTAQDIITSFLALAGGLIVSGIVNCYMTIPATILLIIFYFIGRFYSHTARDLKRLEGIARSPVFSHVSNTLSGLTTIRAFKAQKMFQQQFYSYQDQHTKAWYTVICGTVWLGTILDWICAVFIAVLTAILIFVTQDINGGNIGLAISSALSLCGPLQWGIRQLAEMQNQMTSVERVLEYSRIEPESRLEHFSAKKPPPDWPQKGSIKFNGVSVTYYINDPPVLKKISCAIYPREKVGIVGRTGAGKSTLISALFRMTEHHGIILIDDVDTKSLRLQDIRSKISIIPQDPVLFTGSVRMNIDPLKIHDDTALWNVLQEVQLKDIVSRLPDGLDAFLPDGGGKFSVGERQLLCMARAILRNNKILILDEATAHVDARTDSLIQNTIKEKFRDCTVLTIAHRLNSIINCDRVLILDDGQIQEFDSPYNLLQNKQGALYEMVKETGPAMMDQLLMVARKTNVSERRLEFNNRQNSTQEM